MRKTKKNSLIKQTEHRRVRVSRWLSYISSLVGYCTGQFTAERGLTTPYIIDSERQVGQTIWHSVRRAAPLTGT